MTGVISYPTPPESNPAIQPEFYQPSRFVISDIDLGQYTIVTTETDNNFVIGQSVRLIIPTGYGSTQLNNMQGIVVALPAEDQVQIQIDSSRYVNSFIPPPISSNTNLPQIIPIGDFNSGQTNSSGRINQGTFIPGSFINISPL